MITEYILSVVAALGAAGNAGNHETQFMQAPSSSESSVLTTKTITDKAFCFQNENGDNIEIPILHCEVDSNPENRGPIQDCFSNHYVSISGLDSNGYNTGGVLATLDSWYISASYALFVGGVEMLSGSFASGTRFYYPGNYSLTVHCSCGHTYYKGFTINSATLYENAYSTYEGGQATSNQPFVITHDFTYALGSTVGHVHSKIEFPDIQNQSSMTFGQAYILNYFYKAQAPNIRFPSNPTCDIATSIYYYAPYGVDDYSWAPVYSWYNSSEQDVDISNAVFINTYHTTFAMTFDIPYYFPFTQGTQHPIMAMSGSLDIYFDVESNNRAGLPVGVYHPISALVGVGFEFCFYLDYRFNNDNYYFFSNLINGVVQLAVADTIALIPVVGGWASLVVNVVFIAIAAANGGTQTGSGSGSSDKYYFSTLFLMPDQSE